MITNNFGLIFILYSCFLVFTYHAFSPFPPFPFYLLLHRFDFFYSIIFLYWFKSYFIYFLFFKRFYLFMFREKGREGERAGEKQQCVVASCAPPPGDWSATHAYALTGSQTCDPLFCRLTLNPLSYTSQG